MIAVDESFRRLGKQPADGSRWEGKTGVYIMQNTIVVEVLGRGKGGGCLVKNEKERFRWKKGKGGRGEGRKWSKCTIYTSWGRKRENFDPIFGLRGSGFQEHKQVFYSMIWITGPCLDNILKLKNCGLNLTAKCMLIFSVGFKYSPTLEENLIRLDGEPLFFV